MRLIKLAVIMSGFPRRSETFAINELLALARRNMLAAIIATKPGDGSECQPGVEKLLPLLTVLPESVRSVGQRPALTVDSLRDKQVAGVHAYFAHEPAAVAERVANELGLPFSFSVHAKDARKISAAELGARAKRAACVIACNDDVAAAINGQTSRVPSSAHLGRGGPPWPPQFDRLVPQDGVATEGHPYYVIPHGVDLERFQVRPSPFPQPLQLIAVGRLVEKKGFHYLLEAVTQLRFEFRLRIYGDGPDRDHLGAMIRRHELQRCVQLCGPITHEALPEAYGAAHILVAPSVVDKTGDRDGLPNVILEAMACGRTVVASNVGAIRAALKDHETGRLLPPADPNSLVQALTHLANNPAERETLAKAGRQHVEKNYNVRDCSERFCQLLETTYVLPLPARVSATGFSAVGS